MSSMRVTQSSFYNTNLVQLADQQSKLYKTRNYSVQISANNA